MPIVHRTAVVLIAIAVLAVGLLSASGPGQSRPLAAALATFSDSVGDADSGLAADISEVRVDHDAGGTITFNIAYANRPCAGPRDGVYVYLDVDRKLWTGGPALGVEYVLILSGSTRQVWATRWNGVAREQVYPPSLQATCESSTSSDAIRISKFDVGVSTGFDFLVGTEFTTAGKAFFDTAPDCCSDRWTHLLATPPPAPPQPVAPPVHCAVPDVRGKSLPAAKAALEKAHCRLGKARRVSSKRAKKGYVIAQKPAPGARRPKLFKVHVTIGRGPSP
jgi:hypothetical protein